MGVMWNSTRGFVTEKAGGEVFSKNIQGNQKEGGEVCKSKAVPVHESVLTQNHSCKLRRENGRNLV